MSDWEDKLDEQLRDVALPPGLLARLQVIGETDPSLSELELAILSDDALDHELCSVALPASLIDRVQRDISSLAVAEELDRQLVDVTVPGPLLKSLRQIPWQLTHRKQWERVALAASLMLVVSLAYSAFFAAWLSALHAQPVREVAWIEVDQSPVTVEATPVSIPAASLTTTETADSIRFVSTDLFASTDPLEVARTFDSPLAVTAAVNNAGATREVNAQFATGQPWQDILLMRWKLLGSPSDVSDRLPPLESLPRRRTTGIQPPMVRGFDRQFFVQQRVPPMVSPDANPQLRKVEIPLSTSTESVRVAWQRLREGRLPDADEMHISDFIAAMDYPLPAAKPGEVGLRIAAGPSPFGRDGARLLQVCAQAGPLADKQRPPVHLTVAVDVSASMGLGGKLATAKRSLREMFAHLGERDRVSLLLFNDRDQTEITADSREDVPVVNRLLDQVTASGGTNLAAGLQRGASLAMSEGSTPGALRQLVLITDGRAPMSATTQGAVVGLLSELREQGLAFTAIDLSTDKDPDADLEQLTSAAKGRLSHPLTQDGSQWLLTDLLLGRPTIVAPDATLQVTFNPKTVAAYRLMGHEPSPLVGLEPATVSLDLRAGQVATGLLEVWLKPNSDDDVATAQLTWRDPSSGEPREAQQRISRLQFVSSFDEAALSLQAAAIAAETGEVLQGSPFVESRNRGLADVRALSYRVNPRLRDRAEYQRFVSLIEAAERLRTERVVPGGP